MSKPSCLVVLVPLTSDGVTLSSAQDPGTPVTSVHWTLEIDLENHCNLVYGVWIGYIWLEPRVFGQFSTLCIFLVHKHVINMTSRLVNLTCTEHLCGIQFPLVLPALYALCATRDGCSMYRCTHICYVAK